LVHPDDPCVRFGVAGFGEANLAELLGAEDRAQDRWVDAGRHFNDLPDVVDADLPRWWQTMTASARQRAKNK